MGDLAKLRWQCRRGTLELDLMLINYLEYCYSVAGDEEKAAFVELLNLEDSRLLPVLMGDVEPASKPQAELVETMRRLMSDRH